MSGFYMLPKGAVPTAQDSAAQSQAVTQGQAVYQGGVPGWRGPAAVEMKPGAAPLNRVPCQTCPEQPTKQETWMERAKWGVFGAVAFEVGRRIFKM